MDLTEELEDNRQVKIKPVKERRKRTMTEKALKSLEKARAARKKNIPKRREMSAKRKEFIQRVSKQYEKDYLAGVDMDTKYDHFFMEKEKQIETPASDQMPIDSEKEDVVEHKTLLEDIPEEKSYQGDHQENAIGPVSADVGYTPSFQTRKQMIDNSHYTRERLNPQVQIFSSPYNPLVYGTNSQGVIFL